MNTSNADASMFQMLLNKFFMIFPPDSYLSWLVFIVLVLILLYVYLLPKRIHDEAIKELENKLATQLELLKLIRSQVEPQKVNAYLAIAEIHGELTVTKIADVQKLSTPERQKQIERNKALFLLYSRFFLFASDMTLNKYISFRNNAPSSESVELLSSPSFMLFADLMVSMRKDLYNNTEIESADFCTILGLKPPIKG